MLPTSAATLARALKSLTDIAWWINLISIPVLVVVLLVAFLDGGRDGLHFYETPISLRGERHAIVAADHADSPDTVASSNSQGWRATSGRLTTPAVGPGATALALATALLPGLLAFGMLYQYRKLFTDVLQGGIFTESNALRIRWIAIYMMAYAVAAAVLTYASGVVALGSLPVSEPLLAPKIDWAEASGVLSGLPVLLLAEAFRLGARLQDENDLTV